MDKKILINKDLFCTTCTTPANSHLYQGLKCFFIFLSCCLNHFTHCVFLDTQPTVMFVFIVHFMIVMIVNYRPTTMRWFYSHW